VICLRLKWFSLKKSTGQPVSSQIRPFSETKANDNELNQDLAGLKRNLNIKVINYPFRKFSNESDYITRFELIDASSHYRKQSTENFSKHAW
jgi:hypothetical protein